MPSPNPPATVFLGRTLAVLALLTSLGCSRPSSPSAPSPVSLPVAVVPSVRATAPSGSTFSRSTAADASIPAIAVVELFTSEGCSSCPPAEDVLAGIIARRHANVFALAFHVDYWDSLGWTDHFGARTNTERQRSYARVMGRDGLYTPQMIVNGRVQLVGSEGARADQEIAGALSKPAAAEVRGSARNESAEAVVVDWTMSPARTGAELLLAAVERDRVVTPTAGENAKTVLRHPSVVRSSATAPADGAFGTLRLVVPASVVRANASLVIVAQDRATMVVLGAASLALP